MTLAAPALRPPRAASALDIVFADPTLRASCLLRCTSIPNPPTLDEALAEEFLLWFALEGRHEAQHVRLTPDYIALLTRPSPPFPTRLAAYVCGVTDGLAKYDGEVGRFLDWYYQEGVASLRLGPLLAPREYRRLAEAASFDVAAPPDLSHLPGVNVIGVADGVLGLGEEARSLVRVLDRAGVSRAIVNVGYPAGTMKTDHVRTPALLTDRPLFPINVVCLPFSDTARLRLQRGNALFGGRYNVGYWPWELSSIPAEWRFVFDIVDEVWALTDFLAEVYGRLTTKPVTSMQSHVAVPEVAPMPRQGLGLADTDVVFLCMFDFNSFAARKNPAAAIAAFAEAFPDRTGPERLVVKSLNGDAHPEALAVLKRDAAGDERIVFLDGTFSREDTCALVAAANCYVSLHRAEGFGRVAAEAMLLGVPVIATDWSGTASFVTPETGFPVRYELRPVRPDEYIYAEGSVWAEPSVAHAAELMRHVRQGGPEIARTIEHARRAVEGRYGLDAAAGRLTSWLERYAAAPRREPG